MRLRHANIRLNNRCSNPPCRLPGSVLDKRQKQKQAKCNSTDSLALTGSLHISTLSERPTSFGFCRETRTAQFEDFEKHSRQNTGLPCAGLNGTVVSTPHPAHTTRVSLLTRVFPRNSAWHFLQCFGSFLNPLVSKNACSPAEKTKLTPQRTHFKSRSIKAITFPVQRKFSWGPPESVVSVCRTLPEVKL
jgi:hypothetical protein